MTKRSVTIATFLCLAAPGIWQTTYPTVGAAEPNAAVNEIDLTWGVKVPVRDGIKLNATLYKPKNMRGTLPVVCTMTPYIADSYHDRAMYFARNGYVFALVDVRGRGNSEGTFEPFANDSRDGHDVVEWLAKQSWSSGKVALWGGSYAGFNQWAALKEFPPHLTTIVPAAAAHPGVDFPAPGNIFMSYDIKRARYSESLRQEHLVKPGAIERYEFSSFRFFSRRLDKGSRLRLVFSSPNSIYVEKNFNSGGEVAAESRKDARTAHGTVYKDEDHPSYLEIPVVLAPAAKAEKTEAH